MKTFLYHVCKCDDSSLTRARASTIAPFLRRHLTTSTWPARAAMCKAVSPRCANDMQQHTVQTSQCTFWKPITVTVCSFDFQNQWLQSASLLLPSARFTSLTMLLTSAEAPFCSRSRTMFRWPMKAATWMGVRPDWTRRKQNRDDNIVRYVCVVCSIKCDNCRCNRSLWTINFYLSLLFY